MAGEEPKTVPVSTIEVDTDSPVASTKYDSDRERQESPTQPLPGKSTFETEDHRLYRPIDSYEGIHRWDPDFRWTEEEERKIVRKVGQSIVAIRPPGL